MKRLLLYDSDNDSGFEADVETILIEFLNEEICVEKVRSVSEVMNKSIFWKSSLSGSLQNNYDIFVICLKETDVERWDFVQYVVRNKPQLPIVMISLPDSSWLTKRFISKTEKIPVSATTSQELIDKISILLNDVTVR